MRKKNNSCLVRWEDLTASEFVKMVKISKGVCVVPVGSMEMHGAHLPLGADTISSHEVAVRAARLESTIVFPRYYFGQDHESKNQPGCIALRRQIIFDLLDNLCDEIARNGLTKIILLNGHGGNEYILPYFAMTHLERPRPYQVFTVRLEDYYIPKDDEKWRKMLKTKIDWHGGETETSQMLALFPEHVRTDKIGKPGMPTKRLKHLPALVEGFWWTAEFPGQYAGDARHATVEKGKYLLDYQIKKVAAIIKAVKEDKEVEKVAAEFFAAADPHDVAFGPKRKSKMLR